MAKRKRLNPIAGLTGPADPEATGAGPGTLRRPPIAEIAGDASAHAALAELSDAMETARAEGRMILSVPLDDIEEWHLLRDRLPTEDEESAALVESLRARGQQVPIELRDMGPDHLGRRYGLISGWRRLTALRKLHAETGEARFATALAVLRRPDTAAEAYLAMVEENEIRVGLSYYERARVAARAAEAGVFEDSAAAIRVLFASASKAKRSKIGSFVRVYEALDEWLAHPAEIPERLGLRIAKVLDAGGRKVLTHEISMAAPGNTEAELAALTRGVNIAEAGAKGGGTPVSRADSPPEVIPGVRLKRGRSGLTLSGPGVDSALEADLETWLRRR